MQASNLLLTQSSISTYRNCPRKFQYSAIEEIGKINETVFAMDFGTLGHAGLESWLMHHDLVKASRFVTDKANEMSSEIDLWTVTAAVKGYARRWGTSLKVIKVEDEFYTTFEDVRLGGKIDALVDLNGVYIMDHKFIARLDGNYLRRLSGDFQSMFYVTFWGEANNEKPLGMIYDIIQRCGLKRKATESDYAFFSRVSEYYDNPSHYHREFLFFNRGRIQYFLDELAISIRSIKAAIERFHNGDEHAFIMNPHFCFSYNRTCSYYDLCQDPDNPIIKENFYQHKPAHSELSISQED